jgi:hypothetical protein
VAHIYAVAFSPRGPTKIGYADNPIQRLIALQIGNPYRLRIYFAAKLVTERDICLVESAIHNHLKDHCLMGEWFGIGPALARAYITTALAGLNIGWKQWRPSKQAIEQRQAILDRHETRQATIRTSRAKDEWTWQRKMG